MALELQLGVRRETAIQVLMDEGRRLSAGDLGSEVLGQPPGDAGAKVAGDGHAAQGSDGGRGTSKPGRHCRARLAMADVLFCVSRPARVQLAVYILG